MYYWYVDDTFAAFNEEDECNEFFSHPNSLHPSLRFTFAKECNRALPFLGSRKIRRKQVCRWKTRLRKFRCSQILHPQYLPPTLYTPFHCTLPRTFTYRARPFCVHCLLPIRRNFLRRVFLWQICLRRIFRTRPFLNVLIEKNDHEFVTSVYRKPTFTGQYIRWNSFCSVKRKTNLISTFVHRALVICSESILQNELSNIRTILINNVYPEAAINTVIIRKINQFRRPTLLEPKKSQLLFTCHCWAMFRWGMKCKLKQPSKVVTLQLNHALPTPPRVANFDKFQ